jgi:lipopolysaccharide transport system ATP-binding protein
MQPAIRVENIGKSYRLQHAAARGPRDYRTLRESLTGLARAPLRRLRGRSGDAEGEEFWALRDVSFDVEPGQVVGIIGRNGAGKSTLLKVLSRITKPTTGQVQIRGRVGSLLEVGTGFHPELSGRENVFLNGSILGMSRRDIARRFDEIVSFAEIGKFVDTPVKRYSSGMYVRLAFAVAAHLDLDIMVVDEVLAVGDTEFQKKCLGKMDEVAHRGRTVLFVSHSMAAVTRLCGRVILLADGMVAEDGSPEGVARHYLRSGLGTSAARAWAPEDRPGNRVARLGSVSVRSHDGVVREAVDIRQPVRVETEYEVLEAGHVLTPNLHFFNEEGTYLFVSIDQDPAWRHEPRPAGKYVSSALIPGNLLAEGTVIVGAALTTMTSQTVHYYERESVAFQVVDSLAGDSARGDYGGSMPGVFRPMLQWETRAAP